MGKYWNIYKYLENIVRGNVDNGISEDSRAIIQGWHKDAQYRLFYSIYIWMIYYGLVTETKN